MVIHSLIIRKTFNLKVLKLLKGSSGKSKLGFLVTVAEGKTQMMEQTFLHNLIKY